MLKYRLDISKLILNNMFQCVLSTLALMVSVCECTTRLGPCIHNYGELPIHAEMIGCASDEGICQLPQHQETEMNIVFEPPQDMTSIKTSVQLYLYLGAMPILLPYEWPVSSQTCNFLVGRSCPVQKGQTIQYRQAMLIDFPSGFYITMEFRLINVDYNEPFMCVRMPIQIIQPLTDRAVITSNNGTVINITVSNPNTSNHDVDGEYNDYTTTSSRRREKQY